MITTIQTYEEKKILEDLRNSIIYNLALNSEEASRLTPSTLVFQEFEWDDIDLADLAHHLYMAYDIPERVSNKRYFEIKHDKEYTLHRFAQEVYEFTRKC